MSNRYKGGVISATPPTTTGGESGTASGAWTLEQQMQLQAAGLWPAQPTGPWIEDCFSTYLYTGNGSTQTITNGINLSGKGGLVWYKDRTTAYEHQLVDTVRGAGYNLESPNTSAQASRPTALTAFNTTGFTLGSNAAANGSGDNFVSWTFRKQEKFFDVVTYTGDGSSPRAISHSLGSAPGCVIIKQTNAANDWCVWHTATGNDKSAALNTTAAFATFAQRIKSVTSTTFSVGNSSTVNDSGATYVAYLFAHDAGGFGLTGTDNVISCGSYTGNGSTTGPVIDLGYEPQWLLVKQSSASGNDWILVDNMRGFPVTSNTAYLNPNNSFSESNYSLVSPTATGFQPRTTDAGYNGNGSTYIYIAIRRGPMKVPTSGTSVYETITSSASAGTVLTTGFPVDLQMQAFRSTTGAHRFMDRLRGVSTNSTAGSISLASTSTAAETTSGSYSLAWNNTGFQMTSAFESTSGVFWNFRRAPSFFDEVCYTGDGTNLAINHNLQAVPELIILKYRQGTSYGWKVTATGLTNPNTYYLDLNDTNAEANYTSNFIYNRTSTTFTVVSDLAQSGWNWVAYLFATCAGVSKVGSYTGTGTTQQVDCGFTGGARFVLIKRTDSTGDWYVWDSARGIVAGNDPYLLLNSTAAEVTGTDYVDTYSAGFEITSTAPAAINANGGTFIFLAIA